MPSTPFETDLFRFLRLTAKGSIRVEWFGQLVAQAARSERAELRSELIVVVDVFRVILFVPSFVPEAAGLDDLIRHLHDGYPLQPSSVFLSATVLDSLMSKCGSSVFGLMGEMFRGLRPGEYATIDLLSGEIQAGLLVRHPESTPLALTPANAIHEIPVGDPLASRRTDRSLRSAPAPDLTQLVGRSAGLIRHEEAGEDESSLSVAWSQIHWDRGRVQEWCFGKALSPHEARRIALCEALERYQTTFVPDGMQLVYARYAEIVDRAVDPAELFWPTTRDMMSHTGADAHPITWTWAWGPRCGCWRLVPAQEVWFRIPRLTGEPRLITPTTSACALGATFEEAALHALLEGIERDGFLTAWYLQRPAREIDAESLCLPESRLLLGRFRIAFPGYRLVLFDLTSDVGIPTVGGLAVRHSGAGPKVLAAAAAHLDAERATLKTLRDLTWLRTDLTETARGVLRHRLASAREIAGPLDHARFYALDENFGAFDYLQCGTRPRVPIQAVGCESPVPVGEEMRLDEVIRAIDRRLHEVGAAVYLKDLTHAVPAAGALHAVRALTPGLYPIWFTAAARRFAITERLHRLAQRYTGEPLREDRLQLAPHPLA